jgi:hypothetical protein
MKTYLEETAADSTIMKESRIFNITGTLAQSLPDSIYTCYDIPKLSAKTWVNHYATFENFDDF